MRVVREKAVLDVVEKIIGKAADKDSIELIDCVLITEDEIVVESVRSYSGSDAYVSINVEESTCILSRYRI